MGGHPASPAAVFRVVCLQGEPRLPAALPSSCDGPAALTVPRPVGSRLAESGPGGQSRLLPIRPSSWEEGMPQGFYPRFPTSRLERSRRSANATFSSLGGRRLCTETLELAHLCPLALLPQRLS